MVGRWCWTSRKRDWQANLDCLGAERTSSISETGLLPGSGRERLRERNGLDARPSSHFRYSQSRIASMACAPCKTRTKSIPPSNGSRVLRDKRNAQSHLSHDPSAKYVES